MNLKAYTIVPENSRRFTVAENAKPKLRLPIIAWAIHNESGSVVAITPEGPVLESGTTVLFDDRTLTGKKLKKPKFKIKTAA